ncbi:hypothetical protein RvY_05599 [Ramazzottius varieornatus]|uniref:Spaetzle domain-containing protein n=1 Tax=Ramazzottius varieornatus TaxID=947166 RepID=A0A1D1UW47_RAMVA|nr:hypothetical protein RvY_05599 [Ramazzottius varieornatus]
MTMWRLTSVFLVGIILLASSFASDSPEPKKKRKGSTPDDPFLITGYYPEENAGGGQSTVSSREAGGEESEGDEDSESEAENEGGSAQKEKTTRPVEVIPAVEVVVDLAPQVVVPPPEPTTPPPSHFVEVPADAPVVVVGEPLQAYNGQLQYQDAPLISRQHYPRSKANPVYPFVRASVLSPKPSVYPVQSKYEAAHINVISSQVNKNINIGYHKDYPAKTDYQLPTQVSLLVPSPLSQTKVLPYPNVTPASYIIKNRKSHPGYRVADQDSLQLGYIVPTPPSLNPSLKHKKAHAPAANPEYQPPKLEVPPPRYQPKYNEVPISPEIYDPPTTTAPPVYQKPDHLNQVPIQYQNGKPQERYSSYFQPKFYFPQPAPSVYQATNNPYPVVESLPYLNQQYNVIGSNYPEYALYRKFPKEAQNSVDQPTDYLAYPGRSQGQGLERIVLPNYQAPTILHKAHGSSYGSTVHVPAPLAENPPAALPTEAAPPAEPVALLPVCAEETGLLYCLDDPEYPMLEITTFIAQHPDTYQLLRPIVPWTHAPSGGQNAAAAPPPTVQALPQRSNYNRGPQVDKMCASLLNPSGKVYRALNAEEKWKVIVHLPDSYQMSLLETCDTNRTCHYVNPRVPTQCEQEYALQQMMVFSPEFGVHVDQMKIPLGCKCTVLRQPSQSSINSPHQIQSYSTPIAR